MKAKRKADPEMVVRTFRCVDAVDTRDRKALAAAGADGSSRRDGMVRVEMVKEVPYME